MAQRRGSHELRKKSVRPRAQRVCVCRRNAQRCPPAHGQPARRARSGSKRGTRGTDTGGRQKGEGGGVRAAGGQGAAPHTLHRRGCRRGERRDGTPGRRGPRGGRPTEYTATTPTYPRRCATATSTHPFRESDATGGGARTTTKRNLLAPPTRRSPRVDAAPPGAARHASAQTRAHESREGGGTLRACPPPLSPSPAHRQMCLSWMPPGKGPLPQSLWPPPAVADGGGWKQKKQKRSSAGGIGDTPLWQAHSCCRQGDTHPPLHPPPLPPHPCIQGRGGLAGNGGGRGARQWHTQRRLAPHPRERGWCPPRPVVPCHASSPPERPRAPLEAPTAGPFWRGCRGRHPRCRPWGVTSRSAAAGGVVTRIPPGPPPTATGLLWVCAVHAPRTRPPSGGPPVGRGGGDGGCRFPRPAHRVLGRKTGSTLPTHGES